MDFNERKYHLGGKLGVALLEEMKRRNWIFRKENSREHVLTEEGVAGLREYFGCDV